MPWFDDEHVVRIRRRSPWEVPWALEGPCHFGLVMNDKLSTCIAALLRISPILFFLFYLVESSNIAEPDRFLWQEDRSFPKITNPGYPSNKELSIT
ncbi:hypothetical protein TWF730_004964 [Orbilia blumenaviensis]|uniref:Uncharacterized protein n=1 Tax=Orbilia blumenaviensis TaxID=1796055 RepID=A0AAV9VGV4_9PEZI